MKVEEVEIVGNAGITVTAFEKRLSARERSEPEALARLRGESALLAALGGRVTPLLLDAGEDERGPWLRTEKIPFPTLAHRLERAAAEGEPILEALWVERAICTAFAALAELHEAADASGPLAIVHADISPANVAVDDGGDRVRLLDLELASWRGGSARDGAFRGTVAYCAPEVARGEPPTIASDLFSLAATFLHAMAGAPPRGGPSLAAVLAIAAERPILDEAHVARLDLAAHGPAHAALVRCLAHEPRERPASAREVLSCARRLT